MQKKYSIEVDCANCAAAVERKLSELEGIEKVSISFMAQKMTIEAPDEIFDEVLDKAAGLIAKIEPDCKLIIK